MKTVSVIVPVWKGEEFFSQCMRALQAQTYPQSLTEIIVVDNGATPTLKFEAANVRVLWEPKPGSYSARNAGASVAQGDFLGFTDIDCTPDPTWIARAVSALGEWSAFGGDVIFTARRPTPSPCEAYDSLTSITQQFFVETEKFAATANLWVRREVWYSVGPFLESSYSGGDVEWGQRLLRGGHKLHFAPQVKVFHPTRMSVRALEARVRRTYAGRRALRKRGLVNTNPPSLQKRVILVAQGMWSLRNSFGSLFVGRVLAIAVWLRWVVAAEFFRLWWGGKPNRI